MEDVVITLIICFSLVGFGVYILRNLFNYLHSKLASDYNKAIYLSDTDRAINAPPEVDTINEEIMKEINNIKSHISSIELSKGIVRRN